MNDLDISIIKKTYSDNFSKIHLEFNKIQRLFLIDIHKINNFDLDKANISLIFIKNLHQEILRKREVDLEYDISFNNFWKNHLNILQRNIKLINISNETKIPKETARRKVQELIKEKIFKKINNVINWHPEQLEKENYDKLIEKHLEMLTNFIINLAIYLKIYLKKEVVKNEIKKNFSFYWFRYLNAQIKYLSIWQDLFSDLELLMICIEFEIEAGITYKNFISAENYYLFKKNKKNNFKISSLSSTSISLSTNLPRSTCIRKLKKLNKIKILQKDLDAKKYFINTEGFYKFKTANQKVIDIFSDFYLIILKNLMREKVKL